MYQRQLRQKFSTLCSGRGAQSQSVRAIIPSGNSEGIRGMTLYANLPARYRVAHLTIEPNIILAPMVGVTDSIFRRTILSLGGCGLVSSEMTNAASVSPRAIKHHHQLEFLPEERPITMQLSGNDPELMANAARM